MVSEPAGLRQVVAALPRVRLITALVLVTMLLAGVGLPRLALPVVEIWGLLLLSSALHAAWLVRAQMAVVPEWLAGATLTADVLLLTGLLDITGGPYNPFIALYAVYVWLAAVTLSPRWGVLAGTVAAAGSAWLVFDHLRAGQAEHHRLNDLPTHVFTMWMAGAAVLELVAHYVLRADAALAARQAEVDQAQRRAARSEYRESLMTLAAGAAHELSTPLATIALTARELERAVAHLVPSSPDVAAFHDDARLIRTEVERCRLVLDAMTGRAPSGVPHAVPMSVREVVETAHQSLPDADRPRLDVELGEVSTRPVDWGAEGVQALRVLLRNALEAGRDRSPVHVRAGVQHGRLRLEVTNVQGGMSPEARRRVGEPFFTTKPPGQGLGLGVFLARAFAERRGGSLEFLHHEGTTAVLEVPVDDEAVLV